MKLWRDISWKRRIAVLAAGSTLVGVTGIGVVYATTDVPEPNSIATDQALRLRWSDGTEMARFGKNRVMVRLDQVSPAAQKAILAAENRDFYTEPGISLKGIARAVVANIKGGGVSQGGSTITQQYAKNAFLTQERTFSRKFKEIFIAVKMSRTVSKDQVLEDYLNTIYFGRGAFGIEAAAVTYFGRHAAKLTASQAAVLASSVRSPAGYDPARHPERAKERWAYVLDGMLEEGWLTEAERAAAVYPKVKPQSSSNELPGDLDHVRDQVVEDLLAHGFPESRIAAGGLVVTTTLSKNAQNAARKAVQAAVPAGKPDAPVGALVGVEPGTGRVLAYYGGSTAGGLDLAENDERGVQPGSTMKPYVLAVALEQGKKLTDLYDGRSPQDVCGQKGLRNDAGDPPFGKIDLSTAMVHSVNTVYARLACDVGPREVSALAHAAGIDNRHPLDGDGSPSIQVALGAGGYEVHPLDQAVGYATFAAGGVSARPYFVDKVADRSGNVIYEAEKKTSEVFSADIAADVTFALQGVVTSGTGRRAAVSGRPIAGKTGTTQDNKAAWFCGYTPQIAVAVWVGRPSGRAIPGAYGGSVAAPIFRSFLAGALAGEPVVRFPARANIGPTPSPTPTPTPTPSPSASPTPSATPSAAVVPTASVGVPTLLPSASPTETPSPTPSA